MTPDTLFDAAARAELGQLDKQTALMVKLCEATAEAKFWPRISELESKRTALEQKHTATLRELRERLDSIRFDDVLKLLLGISGGFLTRAFSEKGIDALRDEWVDIFILAFVLSLFALVVRYVAPSTRKKEIADELAQLHRSDQ